MFVRRASQLSYPDRKELGLHVMIDQGRVAVDYLVPGRAAAMSLGGTRHSNWNGGSSKCAIGLHVHKWHAGVQASMTQWRL